MMILDSCCNKQIYDIKKPLPIHRLQIIEKPTCKNITYKDLVDCLIIYKIKLEQSNTDKNEFLKGIKTNNTWNIKTIMLTTKNSNILENRILLVRKLSKL